MTCQPGLDTEPARCFYATRPSERPHCTLTAVIRYGTTPLCADCAARRSTLGRGLTPQPLPPHRHLDLLAPITQADKQLHQAKTELASAVHRARAHGHTWTTIGDQLNITRQAAQQRFQQQQPPRS